MACYRTPLIRRLFAGLLLTALVAPALQTAGAASLATQVPGFQLAFGQGWTNSRQDPTDARQYPARIPELLHGLGLPEATAERLTQRILTERGRQLLISDARVRDLETGQDYERHFDMTFGANGIVFAMYSALGDWQHAMGELFEEDGYHIGLMHDCGNLVLLTPRPLPDFSKPALLPTKLPPQPYEPPTWIPPTKPPEPKYPPFPPPVSHAPIPGSLGLLLGGLALLLLNARRG